MAQIELRISSKVQKVTGRSEIMIRFFQGNSFDLYAKSEIFINPAYFEYYINREKTEKAFSLLLDYCFMDSIIAASFLGVVQSNILEISILYPASSKA